MECYARSERARRRLHGSQPTIGGSLKTALECVPCLVRQSIDASRAVSEDPAVHQQVLRDAPCPATLVECGFLSNDTEAQLLQNKKFMGKIANAVAIGIDDYIGQVRKARLIAADTDI